MKTRTILPLILLPVYFTLHRYSLYSGMVPAKDALLVALELIGITLLLFFLLNAWRKDNLIASLVVTVLMAYHLFFGEIRSAFPEQGALHELSRYRLFLPISLLLLFLILRAIWRSTRPIRLFSLINLVLALWILIDIGSIFRKKDESNDRLYALRSEQRDQLMASTLSSGTLKPNIYYLVFDSHPSDEFLHLIGATDSVRFDDSLRSRGFQVAKGSRSNYDQTPLSISSTLNIGYLSDVRSGLIPSARNYTEALHDIDHAVIPDWFVRSGYRFVNLSMFRIAGKEPIWKDDFLVLSPRDMLLHPNAISSIRRDLLWAYLPKNPDGGVEGMESLTIRRGIKSFNMRVQDSLFSSAKNREARPSFLYAHLYLPHRPYYFAANGRAIDEDSALARTGKAKTAEFMDYLAYTDKWILRYVDKLREQDPEAVILIQSDHGCRDLEVPLPRESRFMNYIAVRLPGKTVQGLDGMTNINTFPVLLHELFRLDLPRLKDSLIITR